MRDLTVLHVVGSPTSRFWFDLSLLYAAPVVRPAGFRALFAVAYPSGEWALGARLDAPGERLSLAEFLTRLPRVDLVVPHLFCPAGLAAVRDLFEVVLGLPLVGSPAAVLRVAQDKHLTRLVAAAAGVRVPAGVVLEPGDGVEVGLGFPVIVKPATADNSDGLALVQTPAELPAALAAAFAFGRRALVEAFVPGREIRGAVVERNGRLETLAYIEYGVSAAHPVRFAANKLRVDDGGALVGQERESAIAAVCPAVLAPALRDELGAMMTAMHRALGCRDFSLYDFRVHAGTGMPVLLEAGLFWSFGPLSMVSQMLAASGLDLDAVAVEVWQAAAGRGARRTGAQ